VRVCVQVAYVSSGQSEVAVQFCYLAMSAIVHEFRFTNQTVDVYPIVSDQLGHVTDDEIVKLLRDEIGVRYASKIGVSISANPLLLIVHRCRSTGCQSSFCPSSSSVSHFTYKPH